MMQLTRRMAAVSMSVVDLIILDHERLRAMYEAYLLPGSDPVQRQLLAWEMICEVSSHAAKEEMVLYPAVRAALGDAVADRCLTEHAAVKSELARLDTMVVTDPGFDELVVRCVEATLEHVRAEEAEFLPQFSAAVTPETLLQMGIQFEAAKARAPTRPHPEAPNLPPFNEASYAAAKQIDTLLDQSRLPSVIPPAITLANVGAVPPPVAMSEGAGGAGDVMAEAS